MFRRRSRAAAAAASAAPGEAVRSAEAAVLDAERIVREAWAGELARQQAHADYLRRVAATRCDIAYWSLLGAQRGGNPRKIAAAHVVLEAAMTTLRGCVVACERIRQEIETEKDRLERDRLERDRAERSAAVAPADVPGRRIRRPAWFKLRRFGTLDPCRTGLPGLVSEYDAEDAA